MERLFVYGTLRPSLYPWRKRPGGPVEEASLTGNYKLWNLGRFPAVVESQLPQRIVGETFEVEHIAPYDSYEGYLPNGKGLYDRKKVKIQLKDEVTTLEAWVYFMHHTTFHGEDGPKWAEPIESGDWGDVVLNKGGSGR